MDKTVGAAFHRLEAAQKQERCATSKLNAIMNDYRRAVEAIASGDPVKVWNGELRCRDEAKRHVSYEPPIRVWSDAELAATLDEQARATIELVEAERNWQAVTGRST